ncbi:MAG: phosphoribosylglycinamide formyltransferase [Candidatus Dormiibacterota bacterium]
MTTPSDWRGTAPRPRLAILASGRGTNLRNLLERGYPIAAVATNRPSSGAAAVAREHGLPLGEFPQSRFPTAAERDAAMLRWLRGQSPEIVVLAGYDRIVPAELVRAFAGRILNIHPSLLPAFAGGMDAVEQALRAGVKITGCTVHLVTEDVDAGPILQQAGVPILDGDTALTLHARIQAEEYRILPAAINELAAARAELSERTS